MKKGCQKDTDTTASEGVLGPLEAFFHSCITRLFPNVPKTQTRKEGWKMIKKMIQLQLIIVVFDAFWWFHICR